MIPLDSLLENYCWPMLEKHGFVIRRREAYRLTDSCNAAVIKFHQEGQFFFALLGVLIEGGRPGWKTIEEEVAVGAPTLSRAQYYLDIMPPQRSRWGSFDGDQRWNLASLDLIEDLTSSIEVVVPFVDQLLTGKRSHPNPPVGLRYKRPPPAVV